MNRQEEIETDEHLIQMQQSTDHLKQHISIWKESLEQQKKQVSGLSSHMQDTQKKMNSVTDRLGVILKTKDNKQLYTIIILWLVLMFQLFLLFFT